MAGVTKTKSQAKPAASKAPGKPAAGKAEKPNTAVDRRGETRVANAGSGPVPAAPGELASSPAPKKVAPTASATVRVEPPRGEPPPLPIPIATFTL